MTWWQPHIFEEKRSILEMRARVVRAVRRFFDDQDFLEVETPILQIMPGADVHIHSFKVDNAKYLHNSPEFAMKKLLVSGLPKIYQICKVFRRESLTKTHRPEFTMLEWYRAGMTYEALMEDCQSLIQFCAKAANVNQLCFNSKVADPFVEFERLSVSEAFDRYVGIDLAGCLDDRDLFASIAKEKGIRVIETDAWDDIFHAIMAEKIESHLGQGAPTILYDYPTSMACLARKKPSASQWAERFELYICGLEIANAFSELTDPVEQRTRFNADMNEKYRLYGERYPLDEDFLTALEHGLPESAGIALGIDRLIMVLSGAQDVQQVLWAEV